MKLPTCVFAAGLGVALTASSQTSPPSPGAPTNRVVISTALVQRLANEARTNSPSLRAANSRASAAASNAGAVRTWEDPTVMLGGSVYGSRGFTSNEDGDLTYGVEQKLPLWGRPQLARRVADTEFSMRQAEVDYRIQQLRRDVARALITTSFAERVVEVGEEDLAWLEATARTAENKYRAGQAAVADSLQVQNELARRNDMLRTDRLRLGHEHLTLNRVLNRDVNSTWPSLVLPPVGPAIPFSEKLLSLALLGEPKLKILEQEIRQAGAAAELTRKSRLPDVSVGIEGRQFSGDGGFRSGMFTVRLSLPWVNKDRYRLDYARDLTRIKGAEEERDEQILVVKEELHHLAVGIEASRRETLLHRDEILPRAAQALTSRLSDWETGRGMLREVLDARRMLLESQLVSSRAASEQNQMMIELLLWTGLESFEALYSLAGEPAILIHDEAAKGHHE